MDWNTIAGNWNEAKGKVKTQWGKLTDDDLTYVEGKRDRLLGLLQQKYGMAKDKAEEQLNQFTSSSADWISQAKEKVGQAVGQAKEKVTEVVKEGKEYFQNTNIPDMATDLRKLIERNPIPSVLLGLGLGFLIGRVAGALRS
jgi:uncharacterized protein YjbJ (UPF0337 family)